MKATSFFSSISANLGNSGEAMVGIRSNNEEETNCPSLQRCCWKMLLLSLHPNIIVYVKNVVSLFSSPSTSSQKVRKCGGHKFLFFTTVARRYTHAQKVIFVPPSLKWTASEKAPSNLLFSPLIAIVKG